MNIEENDILVFKNGLCKLFHERERWLLNAFYDENLKCKINDSYSIVKVIKAEYKEKVKRRENK